MTRPRTPDRLLVRALAACSSLVAFAAVSAFAGSRTEDREALLGFLRDRALREGTPSSAPALREEDLEILETALGKYRFEAAPAAISIENAPYPDFVIGQKLPELYRAAYESAYPEQKKKAVDSVSLVTLFDAFLSKYLEKSLPPALQGEGEAIGACMARQVLGARSESCALDESEKVRKVSVARIAWHKLQCGVVRVTNPCTIRKALYDVMKPKLIDARRNNPELREMVAAEFDRQFPGIFFEEFKKEIRARRQGIVPLIAGKFGGAADALFWSDRVPWMESDEPGQPLTTLSGWASGLEADITSAALLAKHAGSPEIRGQAAALFYGSANRLLWLTGQSRAIWATGFHDFLWDNEQGFDEKKPLRAPVPRMLGFGGLGVPVRGATDFAPWDWAAYDPLGKNGHKDLRLFPNAFQVNALGQPEFADHPESDSVQNLGDLTKLLSAFAAFLRETHPKRGVFAPYFGSAENLGDLLDPEKPMIFPAEGRAVAIGAVAGVLKNLIAPRLGHLEQKDSNDPDFGLGLEFYERVGRGGRLSDPARTVSVARALLAADELRKVLAADPDAPAELKELLPQIDQMVQIGSIAIGARAQESDGKFREEFDVAVGSQGPRMIDTVMALRAMTRAWNRSELPAIGFRIHQGWLWLDRFWKNESLRVARTARSAARSQALRTYRGSELWEWVQLWHESQKIRRSLGGGFSPAIPWEQWEDRMADLQVELRENLLISGETDGLQPFARK